MIIQKYPEYEDSDAADAPPSYDDLAFSSNKNSSVDTKPPLSPIRPSDAVPAQSSSTPLADPTLEIKKITAKKSKGSTSWFPFTTSRTAKEVRITVLNLVRDLVKYPSPAASSAILESCAEACSTHGVSFASLLQEKSVEYHTPIYWAIVKRPPEPTSPNEHDLLTALLTLAAPLSSATISEMRLACLVANDQVLFQRLRLFPAFSSLSGTDEILLGANIPPDTISVEDVGGDQGAFLANFEIPLFQRRMRISQKVALEFIARGRMWRLSFAVAPRETSASISTNKNSVGSWVVVLALLEHSPSTWLDSRLIIAEPPPSTPRQTPTPSLIDTPIPGPLSQFRNKSKSKPTITLRLKTGSSQLAPPAPKSEMPSEIVVPLSDSLMGQSLQYDGTTYLTEDGTLHARLEAKLAKPNTDCIIC